MDHGHHFQVFPLYFFFNFNTSISVSFLSFSHEMLYINREKSLFYKFHFHISTFQMWLCFLIQMPVKICTNLKLWIGGQGREGDGKGRDPVLKWIQQMKHPKTVSLILPLYQWDKRIRNIGASIVVPLTVEVTGSKQTVCMYCCQQEKKTLSLKAL